jgi:hypothetical protein
MAHHGIFKAIGAYARNNDRQPIINKHIDKLNVIDPDTKTTPLIAAIEYGDIACALQFIANGADVNLRAGGVTPLMALVTKWNGRHRGKLLRALLDAGANVRPNGESVMQIAVDLKRTKVIQTLIDRGVERERKNRWLNSHCNCSWFSQCDDHDAIEKMMHSSMKCAVCSAKGEVYDVCGCYDFAKGRGLCGDCASVMKIVKKCGACNQMMKLRVDISLTEKYAMALSVMLVLLMLCGRIAPLDYLVINIVSMIAARLIGMPKFGTYGMVGIHIWTGVSIVLALLTAIFQCSNTGKDIEFDGSYVAVVFFACLLALFAFVKFTSSLIISDAPGKKITNAEREYRYFYGKKVTYSYAHEHKK